MANRKKKLQKAKIENFEFSILQGRSNKFVACFIFVISLIPFLSAVKGEFILDDLFLIENNPNVMQFSSIFKIWSLPYWSGSIADNNLVYRPLVTFLNLLNWNISNGSSLVFHFTNQILHSFNAVLLFFIFRHSKLNLSFSLVFSLLWAVHPLMSEAVFGISYRTDLMTGLFGLSACLLLLQGNLIGLTVALFLAMLSKESGIMWIFILPFLIQFQKRINYQKLIATAIFSLCLYFLLRFHALGHFFPQNQAVPFLDNPIAAIDVWSRILTAIDVLGRYSVGFIFPLHLSADYSFSQISVLSKPDSLWFWIGFISNCILLYLWWSAWRKKKSFSVYFLAIYFIMLALIANIFFAIPNIMAERFMYLPLLGLVGWLALAVARQNLNVQSLSLLIAVAITILFSIATFTRGLDWRSENLLFAAALKTSPNSARVQLNYGNSLYKLGHKKSAIEYFKKSVQIYPQYVLALTNLCVAQVQTGQLLKAREHCLRALKVNPSFKLANDAMNVIQSQLGMKSGKEKK